MQEDGPDVVSCDIADVNVRTDGQLAQDTSKEHTENSENSSNDVAFAKPPGLVLIMLESEHLHIPILSHDVHDSTLLAQLRMFYRFVKVKRGRVEVIIPRSLTRIQRVKVG